MKRRLEVCKAESAIHWRGLTIGQCPKGKPSPKLPFSGHSTAAIPRLGQIGCGLAKTTNQHIKLFVAPSNCHSDYPLFLQLRRVRKLGEALLTGAVETRDWKADEEPIRGAKLIRANGADTSGHCRVTSQWKHTGV